MKISFTTRRSLFVIATGILTAIACTTKSQSPEQVGEGNAKVVWSDAGEGGWVTGPNCYYDGGSVYNYCSWNCHNAANCGVEAGNDGIVACSGASNGSLGGHTVNWDQVPPSCGCAGQIGFCISSPQSGPNTPACCWDQDVGTSIDVSTGPGAACAAKVCDNDGGHAVALDAGVLWDGSALNCAGNTSTVSACHACCDANMATQIPWCLRQVDGGARDGAADSEAGAADAGTYNDPNCEWQVLQGWMWCGAVCDARWWPYFADAAGPN